MRSCDDIDEQALSYAEIKALCAGDPRIREKMDLDVQVAKLKVLRGDFQNQKYRLEDKLLKTFPEEIQKQKNPHCCFTTGFTDCSSTPAGQRKLLRHDHQGHGVR